MNGPGLVGGPVRGQIQGLRMPSRALRWKVFTLEYHHAVSLPPRKHHLYTFLISFPTGPRAWLG